MVDNDDTVKFRGFILKIGFTNGYDVFTEYPVELNGKKRPVDVVFQTEDETQYIEIESGGEAGTSYASYGIERDIKIVAKADRGFILVKNEEPGKRLFNETLKKMNLSGKYNNITVLTWEEYEKQAMELHLARRAKEVIVEVGEQPLHLQNLEMGWRVVIGGKDAFLKSLARRAKYEFLLGKIVANDDVGIFPKRIVFNGQSLAWDIPYRVVSTNPDGEVKITPNTKIIVHLVKLNT